MAANNRDFEWFKHELQLGLRELQQRTNNATLDLNHVLREIPAEKVARLSDRTILQALETYRTLQGEAGSHIRSLLLAEQARRAGGQHRHILIVTWLTLLVAVLTLVATVWIYSVG